MKTIYATIKAVRTAMLGVACLTFVGNAWAENSNRNEVQLPEVAGFTLEPGNMYVVGSTMTIHASHGNGLNVAPKGTKQAPILYIPAGVTLTVTGANAQGIMGGGAGICVPTGAELIITGAGRLVAKGGNAGNGTHGENGKTAGENPAAITRDMQASSQKLVYSGAGGRGGNGGGGAGAGIGGNGGTGGMGGQGGAPVYFINTAGGETSASQKDGNPGLDGENGAPGTAMGKVYITGTVKVTATPGAAGTAGGQGGEQGYSAFHNNEAQSSIMDINLTYRSIAGSGGAGGGGGAGYAAPAGIGAGGRGAGGGAGGGSGAADWVLSWSYVVGNQFACRAGSGAGGMGVVAGGSGAQDREQDMGGSVCQRKGGDAGEAGDAGAEAEESDKGMLYAALPLNVKGGTANSDQAPTDMQISIRFVNNEFNADGSKATNVTIATQVVTIGESHPALATSAYKLSATSKYFAGYYSEDNGLGYRIFKGIDADNNGTLDAAVPAVRYAKNTTLYAHFSHNQHRVNWDYSYALKNGNFASINLADRIKYGKLVFYFRDGTSEAWILDAHDAPPFTVDVNSTYPLKGHEIASGLITLNGRGETAQKTSGWTQNGADGSFAITLADDKLAQFTGYEYFPMSGTSSQADNWNTTTNKDGHVTTFSFVGNKDENTFPLRWTVTLSGLAIYPQTIFVQPMYHNGKGYAVISQTNHTAGIECHMNETDETQVGAGSSRTYSGQYLVWKNKSTGVAYQNKIGLIGFELYGQRYYLKKNRNGEPVVNNPDAIYISKDMVTWTTYDNKSNDCIEMTMSNDKVPVLRLDANGGTLDATSPYIVVATHKGTIAAPNSTYKATRPGYAFLGWADSSTATAKAAKYDNPIAGHTTSSTIYAVWKENVAPVITTQDVEYLNPGVKLTVSVTDNLPGLKVYYHIATGQSHDLASEKVVWEEVKPSASGSNLYEIAIANNRSRAYIWTKAVDAAGNTSYTQSGNLKVDGVAPGVFLYPTGHVCNFDGQFTITDDVEIASIELKHDDGEWYKVTGFKKGATETHKEFILPKPTAATPAGGEGHYSIRVTDGAGNVTEIENIITMYYDHDFAHGVYHAAKDPTETADGALIDHYHCTHNCGHIWATDADKCGPLSNYDRTSTTEKYAQGLMRAATEASFLPAKSFVIKNTEGKTIGATDPNATVNEAIELVGSQYESYTIKFTTNKDVCVSGDGTVLATPEKPVNIDLNGFSMLVYGRPAAVKGNEKVKVSQ